MKIRLILIKFGEIWEFECKNRKHLKNIIHDMTHNIIDCMEKEIDVDEILKCISKKQDYNNGEFVVELL